MNVQIKIKNLPQIRSAFNVAPALMNRELTIAVKKSTFLVEGQSKIKTPVRTGFLRNSYQTSFTGGGLNYKGIVEPTAFYAGFVHEGTRFMQGRPFLRQGLEASETQIQVFFRMAVQNVLNQIGGMV